MSGGSYNYVCWKIEEIELRQTTPLRRAFQAHLKLVAKAMHDIEWVDSGDYAPGDEVKAIEACLSGGAVLEQLIKEAKIAHEELAKAIEKAEKHQ